jgi:hypothetical protein
MTRGELIEAIIRSKRRPWLLRSRARGHQELKKYGGPQYSRARRDLILNNQYRVQNIITRMHNPAANHATPYEARRSFASDMLHSSDDPTVRRVINNIILYGARRPAEPPF